VLDLLTASETASGYTLRAWTGVATDEGVGLISLVEVSDARGAPVCRFEVFVDAAVLRNGAWPRDEREAARRLQDDAVGRARGAIFSETLHELHGHRFDVA
jgi:hypothetical protein